MRLLRDRASELLSLDPDTVIAQKLRTKDIQALLSGLAGFTAFPNVLNLIKELQTWLGEQSKHMALV